ncbi:MAG: PD-(D/E)XK nuclease family protein [Myxococcales bacterium]|nr:PD-(D/E)XK nuclease family protein [Myxococcales bacterium]
MRAFLEGWRALKADSSAVVSNERDFADQFERFVAAWGTLATPDVTTPQTVTAMLHAPSDEPLRPESSLPQRRFDTNAFRVFVAAFPSALAIRRRSGIDFNVWEVAGLEANELRIARVLGRLLDPRGPHGLEASLLRAILELLERRVAALSAERDGRFPSAKDVDEAGFFQVRVEFCPLGSLDDRVDIEIEASTFLLFIEVKVYAPEGQLQLDRYETAARIKARGRPWGVLFLTRPGLVLRTHQTHPTVADASWKDVAAALSRVAQRHEGTISPFLVESARHYAQFISNL